MEILPATPASIARAIQILNNGGVVAHATETCYGLACDLSNPDAVARLFGIKHRPLDQPVSALFSSIDDAKQYVEWNDRAEELSQKYLPGPLTLILRLRSDAPYQLFPIPLLQTTNYKLQTIGVRISSHPLAQELVNRFGKPISTTSANIHGQENPYIAANIRSQFADQTEQPDLILDSGELPMTPPSTVMDLTNENGTIRRKGDITA